MALENIFACTILTNDCMTITKFGDNYHVETSPHAAQAAVKAITAITDKNVDRYQHC
jgi:hypothetical protein